MITSDSEHNWTQNIFKNAPVGMLIVNNRVITKVNKIFCELSGYSENELIGQSTEIGYLDKAEYERVGQILYEQISKSGYGNAEAKLKHKNGSIIDVLISSSISNGSLSDGDIVFAVIDITERNKIRKKLKDEKEFTETAINAQIDTLFIFDPSTGKPIRWNNAFTRLSGYSNEEIASMKAPDDWYDEKDLEKMANIFETISRDGYATVEMSLITKSNQRILTEYRASFINDTEGNPKYIIAIGRDITKNRQIEKNLVREKYFSDSLIQTSPAYFVAIDAEGKTKVMNHTMLKALGYEPEEVIGTDYLTKFIPKRDQQTVHEIFAKLVNLNEPTVNENSLITKDGRELLIEWHGQPVYDTDGRFDFFFGVGIDITEHKQAEEALRKSEEKLSAMLQSLGDHISMMDKDLNILWANDVAKDLFGNDIIGKKCYEVYHGRNKPCKPFPCLTLKAFKDNQIHKHETQVHTPDGKTLVYACTANVALRDDKGNPTGVIEISRDITESKQAEKKLRESEEKLSKAFYLSPDSISISLIETGELIDINKGFEDLFGYGREEAIGKSTIELGIWTNLSDREKMVKAVKSDGRMRNLEAVGRSKSGDTFIGDVSSEMIEINKEKCLITIVHNITNRKRAEEAIRKRERTLDALINAPTESAILVDTDGIILAINRIGAERLGQKGDEIIGKVLYDYLPPKLAKSRKAMGNKVIRSREPIRFQDEREGRYFDNNIYPVFDDKGKVTALAINTRDITRHRQAEIMMRSLVEGTAKATGQDFFNKLVEHLATALNCKYAFISILDDSEPKQITTLSYWDKNKIGENFSFDVTGTPCEDVGKKNTCFYQSQVTKTYPKDKWLIKNKIEAYLGVPILDSKRDPIGVLVIMNTKKFSDDLVDGAHSLMAIFASRAAAEIKRISAEDELRAIADRLRREQKALFDKHVALKQILEHMETEKIDFRHEISSSLEQALMPFVKKLRNKGGTLSNKDIELFEDAVKSITGTEIDDFRANYAKLTAREMDISDLIKEGKSSQEIADQLHLSLQTIQKHRSSIRKKLQLKNKEINLPAYLRYK